MPPEPAAATRMTGESDGAARDRLRALGNDAFGRCRYDEAIRCYSAAIALDDAAQGAEKASAAIYPLSAAQRATLLSNPYPYPYP